MGFLTGNQPRLGDFKNGEDPSNSIGIIFTIIGACLGGLVSVIYRSIGSKQVHWSIPTLYSGLFGIIFLPCILVTNPKSVPVSQQQSQGMTLLKSYGYAAATGVFLVIGQYFLIQSYRYEKISRIMLIKYLQVVLAVMVDVIFFESVLRWTDWLGCGLIISCTFLISLLKFFGVIQQ